MGSFTELVLAFTFAEPTPVEVLSGFSRWKTGPDAPDLPPLEDSALGEAFDSGLYLQELYRRGVNRDDLMAALTPAQCAAMWRDLMRWGGTAYFPDRRRARHLTGHRDAPTRALGAPAKVLAQPPTLVPSRNGWW